jgi:hypothetical protein
MGTVQNPSYSECYTGMRIGCRWESEKEGGHQEDQDVGGWIILGWILWRRDGVMWTGLIWLRIGTGGELL